MKYSCTITVDQPRDRVIELFDNPDNMPKWQDGLVSFTPKSGTPGQPGATSEIVYQMGKRRIEMIETIEERALPDRFSGIYETTGVWNRVINQFEDTADGHTQWRIDTEFRCSGLLKIMSWIFPGMFRKQTEKMMRDFKTFAERS